MNPCSSCAFAEGCAANLEPYNRLRSEVCALAGLPFYCHDTFDWQSVDPSVMTPAEIKEQRRSMNICQGWRNRVRELAQRGHFKNPGVREIRQLLGKLALQTIQRAVKAGSKPEKDVLYAKLDDTIRMLAG